MKPSIKIIIAAVASIAASSGALAEGCFSEHASPRATRHVADSGWGIDVRPSTQRSDQYCYNQSGTAGRMGLGADPLHPEGPGNFSAPSSGMP